MSDIGKEPTVAECLSNFSTRVRGEVQVGSQSVEPEPLSRAGSEFNVVRRGPVNGVVQFRQLARTVLGNARAGPDR